MLNFAKNTISLPKNFAKGIFHLIRKMQLVGYVALYGLYMLLNTLSSIPLLKIVLKPTFGKLPRIIYLFLSRIKLTQSGINVISLIDLGISNITHKKTRSFITIGGMALGIGSIVFLVSLGYGAQKMVVNRVARLEELRQADVSSQPGSKVVINDEQVRKIKSFQDVLEVLPLISVVGRVNYKNSATDMAVYGVTTKYLAESAEKPIKGRVFNSNDSARQNPIKKEEDGIVSGVMSTRVKAKIGDEVGITNYNIQPDKWVRIRKSPDKSAEIIGYAKRYAGQSVGTLVIGTSYPDTEFGSIDAQDDNGNQIKAGKWIQDDFAIWEQKDCDPVNTDCDPSGKYRQIKDSSGKQLVQKAYSAMINVSIYDLPIKKNPESGSVLGVEDDKSSDKTSLQSLEASTVDTIDISEIKASGSAQLALTEIASESAKTVAAIKQVDVSKTAIKEAVVNRAMLSILNIKEDKAVGTDFNVSFVVSGDLLGAETSKLESNSTKYKIVGVIPQDNTPFFYVPFIDLRELGIQNYSQAKIVAKNQQMLLKVRELTEALGFSTSSVVDTIEQIDRLFGTVRVVLVGLGIVALGVAAMGMFNTLTVSLLERTHEVGLMKTMGMKSSEVEDLFLIESVVMGLFGGISGILFGYVAGKLLSLTLTIIALRSGAGVIDISYVPVPFVVGISALSLLVGLATGVYPAYRARKISALNALRYE
ncbi:MAG: FtsX-like permease family protein [Patescibacteria group bacterium]